MSKQNIIILVVGAVLLGSYWLYGKFPQGAQQDELIQVIQGGAQLVDVRTVEEYQSGHIDGSVNIPLNELENRLGELAGKNDNIVVFCYSGGRASQAKKTLNGLGYNKVYNGGGWESLKRLIQGLNTK